VPPSTVRACSSAASCSVVPTDAAPCNKPWARRCWPSQAFFLPAFRRLGFFEPGGWEFKLHPESQLIRVVGKFRSSLFESRRFMDAKKAWCARLSRVRENRLGGGSGF